MIATQLQHRLNELIFVLRIDHMQPSCIMQERKIDRIIPYFYFDKLIVDPHAPNPMIAIQLHIF
jgi:hypothetical protein